VECIDPLTHNYKYMTSLARNSNYRPQKDEYNHSVHFGRTKGYFGGFVDDVLKGVNQQDSVPGAVTWKSAMNAEFNRTASGMVKPFHPQIGPMAHYIDAALRLGEGNPFAKR